MLYPKNKSGVLDKALFENPTSEYRGTPFWAWNCKLTPELLTGQIEILKEMGFGGFHMHSRTGMATPYLSGEFMALVKACVDARDRKTCSPGFTTRIAGRPGRRAAWSQNPAFRRGICFLRLTRTARRTVWRAASNPGRRYAHGKRQAACKLRYIHRFRRLPEGTQAAVASRKRKYTCKTRVGNHNR